MSWKNDRFAYLDGDSDDSYDSDVDSFNSDEYFGVEPPPSGYSTAHLDRLSFWKTPYEALGVKANHDDPDFACNWSRARQVQLGQDFIALLPLAIYDDMAHIELYKCPDRLKKNLPPNQVVMRSSPRFVARNSPHDFCGDIEMSLSEEAYSGGFTLKKDLVDFETGETFSGYVADVNDFLTGQYTWEIQFLFLTFGNCCRIWWKEPVMYYVHTGRGKMMYYDDYGYDSDDSDPDDSGVIQYPWPPKQELHTVSKAACEKNFTLAHWIKFCDEAAKKPVAKKPVAKKPSAKKPAPKKKAAVSKKKTAKKETKKKTTTATKKKPAAKKAAKKQPAPKKTATKKKPAAKKPAAKKATKKTTKKK